MKKNKKIFQGLALLNPRNLEKEVHVYGYHFSWKANIMVMLCSLLGISAIGMLFQLQPVYFAVIVIAVFVILPVLIRDSYKRMFEQKRFADVVTYMEQILYSYQKSRKIISALKETREIFDEGKMRDAIDEAIVYLNEGRTETKKGVLREALEVIQKQYECVKIHTVHELLISGEEYGGEIEDSILLVLSDLELYKRRGYKLQAEKKQSHTDNIISIIVATILCAVGLYVLNAMQGMFPGAAVETSVFQVPVIQLTSFLFILFMLFVMLKSQRSLCTNWLQEEKLHEEGYLLDSYDTVMNYDEGKEKRKSIIFSAPFLVGAVPVFLFYKTWLGIALLIIGTFMLASHRVGYNLAKKDINEELYIALPQWLMEIALLLQTNNVQVAIAKSITEAPAVLQKELELLIERLQEMPDSLKSYTGFCRKFDLPEAQSCMKMLHAISESGTGNAKVQLNNLIMRVNEMQDMADNIQNENLAFKARMIFMYPIGGATVKMLVDLSVGMVFMMSMLGNMGGV